MSLVSNEGEGEQNEIRILQDKLNSTMKLVSHLTAQLNELKEQVCTQAHPGPTLGGPMLRSFRPLLGGHSPASGGGRRGGCWGFHAPSFPSWVWGGRCHSSPPPLPTTPPWKARLRLAAPICEPPERQPSGPLVEV